MRAELLVLVWVKKCQLMIVVTSVMKEEHQMNRRSEFIILAGNPNN